MRRHPYPGSLNPSDTIILPFVGASATGTIPSATTTYMFPMGSNTGLLALFRMPFTCVASGLYVAATATPAAGQTFIYTLYKNASATGLTVTISNGATTGQDTTRSVVFEAGDYWGVEVVTSATAGAAIHGGQFQVERL